MKKSIALLILLCLILGLCACGQGVENENNTTAPDATQAPGVETPTEAPVEEGKATYTVKVEDEAGNPIAGAMVQICADSCFPGVTDAQGVATFANQDERDDYKISFLSLPEGYTYSGEEEAFYFEDGATELTITLKAVA